MTNNAELGERYLRQLGIYDPQDRPGDRVTFVGCGGIGSFAAWGVAKLGVPNIRLIDPDTVESHNIPNQNYTNEDIGENKVDALAALLQRTTAPFEPSLGVHPVSLPDDDVRLSGLVISGLDSMEARKTIWDECIKSKPSVSRYIDARLSGQFLICYALDPSDPRQIEKYEEQTLYDDDDAEDLGCTERGIIDVGMQVGSLLSRLTRRHFNNEEVPAISMMNQETYTTTQGDWLP